MKGACATLLAASALWLGACSTSNEDSIEAPVLPYGAWADAQLDSLEDLSIESLRARPYGSTITPELRIESPEGPPGETFLASYDSDGLRVYTRIDIPATTPPEEGFPVLIFVHGWYGLEKAPAFDFFQQPDSMYAKLVRSYSEQGFVVLSPALRGHGSVNGVPAEGLEFLEKWDNASYLSPVFYTIDVLNLLDGIGSLEKADWSRWNRAAPLNLDFSRISITGHSQGGDAVLAALAISGEGSSVENPLYAGSIASGCFGPRMEQVEIYGPMANTLEAFISGDGSWTGTATGSDGSINPDFVFGWPPDWIVTTDPQAPEWTWQAETWAVATVEQSLNEKFSEMYRALNEGIDDIAHATFRLEKNADGRTEARHDPRIEAAMSRIGGFEHARFLSEPLHFHHSDQDYYSPPRWNADLAARISRSGGDAVDFNYPKNTHSLGVSEYEWFSPGEVVAGFETMIARDRHLFETGNTAEAAPSRAELVSPEGLALYARSLRNRFEPEYARDPLDGLARRVVSFRADGLKQFALVVEPAGEMPEGGWPVLLMNHGYHPEPRKNGKREDGTTDRPGDYYRGLPLAYAKSGFLVVWPDYRGHNVSEGYEFTQEPDPPAWYARDLIAATSALPSLPGANPQKVFLWGHSMGGNVVLRALPALGGQIQGVSLWSTWLKTSKPGQESTYPLSQEGRPLVIQHSDGDPTVPVSWSKEACRQLQEAGRNAHCFFYANQDHLFTGSTLETAIARDIRIFLHKMQN